MLVTTPFYDWGIESSDYYFIYEDFQNYKSMFMDKGIPVIIGELGILTYKSNPNLLSQFFYMFYFQCLMNMMVL